MPLYLMCSVCRFFLYRCFLVLWVCLFYALCLYFCRVFVYFTFCMLILCLGVVYVFVSSASALFILCFCVVCAVWGKSGSKHFAGNDTHFPFDDLFKSFIPPPFDIFKNSFWLTNLSKCRNAGNDLKVNSGQFNLFSLDCSTMEIFFK